MKDKKLNIKFDIKLKLFLVVFIITLCILIGLLINNFIGVDVSINSYKSDYVNFYYDNNFKINSEKDSVVLKSVDNNSTVVINKYEYTESVKKKNKFDLATSLSYQVIKDNNDYIEIYNGQDEKDRYYYLYENYKTEKQIEVITIFDKDYIFVVIYQANSNEFDLYTESISIIIDSIEV